MPAASQRLLAPGFRYFSEANNNICEAPADSLASWINHSHFSGILKGY